MIRPFYSKPGNYPDNIQEGKDIGASAAFLSSPQGPEPGVVIRAGFRIKAVIPAADALRLANEIADAVEAAERTPA